MGLYINSLPSGAGLPAKAIHALFPLPEDYKDNAIFCRGCDKGRSANGAQRDLKSQGGIDIYCKRCCKLIERGEL